MAATKKATRAKVPARVKVTAEAKLALEGLADELAQLRDDEVLRANVDIARAVSLVLGAEPQIRAFEAQLEAALPEHDLGALARLRTYALAALYAHIDAQPNPARGDLSALLAEATPLKQTLIVAAEALAHAGLLDGERLGEIKSGTGHLDLAADLVALAALFDVAWDEAEGKTFVERSQIERAAELGTALLVALGEKSHAASRAAPEALDRKHRAFTLLFRAYDEVRRALTYLRWHEDDIDVIAPSLYKRTRREQNAPEAPTEPSDDDEVMEDDGRVPPVQPGDAATSAGLESEAAAQSRTSA